MKPLDKPELVVVAFDFGLSHIGVAVGQSITSTATPVTTLKAKRGSPHWEDLAALLGDWQPDRLIVGLPLNMDGSESEISARARKFAAKLRGRFDIRVEMVDERLTTFEADLMGADNPHATAACLIAESWLTRYHAGDQAEGIHTG